ncbi:zinc-dependent alcohol dehydrogenase family protein [Paenibacillus sp. NPDC056579]|uniref:zinc-dependent alcohol dehydrogenase family protein n=1 Tax=Paenibacillus sp. NPDC056579 TaxID=3345871 RepID=UPI00368DB352
MNASYFEYARFGDPLEVLELKSKRVTPPASGELLVKMTARPINPSDLIPIRGAYSHRIALPAIPGYEGVGEVIEVGAGVSTALLGKRVLALRGEGTWQEIVRMNADWAVPVPDLIPDDAAAQLYINPMTAWLICRDRLGLQRRDTLIVNAGGSAIGRIFAQLAQLLEYKLIAVTRNDRHTAELLSLGAAHVVNATAVPVAQAVMEWTDGRGAHAGIDSIGGDDSAQLARCIRPGGTVLSIGLLSGIAPDWIRIAKETGVQPSLFWLRHWVERVSVQQWHETFNELMKLIEHGKLRMAAAGSYFKLEEAKEAIRSGSEPGRESRGKILLISGRPHR